MLNKFVSSVPFCKIKNQCFSRFRFSGNVVAVNLLIFLFLEMAALFVYRHGIIDTPRSDHVYFMQEYAYTHSDWNFFKSVLDYPRTRHMHPEHHLSTRCGMMATLAIIDILFHANRYASGLLSILWHGLTAFSLYLLTAGLINRKAALLMALAFVCQFGGMEMVYWRHISPYMFCLAFWGFAMNGIHKLDQDEEPGRTTRRPRKPGTRKLAIVLLLTGATLFHEFAFFTLAAGTVLFFILDSVYRLPFFNPVPVKNFRGIYRFTGICLLPVLLAILINFYQIFQSLPAADHSMRKFLSWASLSGLLDFTGAMTAAWTFPRMVTLDFSGELGRFVWDFSGLPHPMTWALGLVSLLAGGILGGAGVRQYLRQTNRPQSAALLLSLIFAAVILGSLFFIRGIGYMESATYYLYFFIFFDYYFASFALHKLRTSGPMFLRRFFKPPLSAVTMTAVSVFLLTQTVWGYQEIQKALLLPNFRENALYADSALAISRLMKQKSNYCYGGLTDTPKATRLDIMLERYECTDMDDPRTPVYLVPQKGKFVFCTLRTPQNIVRLDAAQDGNRLSFTPSSGTPPPIADKLVLLSNKPYDPLAFCVRLKSATGTYLTLAVRNANNAVMIQPIKRYISATATIQNRDILLDWALGNFEGEYTLSFYKIGNDYYLLRNRNIVLQLKNLKQLIPDLTGHVGVGCKDPEDNKHFGEITLWNTADPEHASFTFEPAPDLPVIPS